MNMDKYFMWIHYEQLHNHNKAKHNKTVCIFFGIYCMIYLSLIVLILVCACPWKGRPNQFIYQIHSDQNTMHLEYEIQFSLGDLI